MRDPEHNEPCRRVRLSAGPFAAVDQCSCGALYVHVGAITMRVSLDELSGLVQTLGQALAARAAAGVSPNVAIEALLATRSRGRA